MHEKERENATNDGWHDESVENVVVCLDESVEMAASRRKKMIVVEDDGCAWKAPIVPSVVPSVAAAAGNF